MDCFIQVDDLMSIFNLGVSFRFWDFNLSGTTTFGDSGFVSGINAFYPENASSPTTFSAPVDEISVLP